MQSNPSAAAQVIMTLIPIIIIAISSAVVFIWLANNHKNKMFMIKKGIYTSSKFSINMFSLFFGFFLICICLTLTFLLLIKERFNYTLINELVSVLKVFAILE